MPFFNLPSGGGGSGGGAVLTGAGAPSSSLGSDGQLYIDTVNELIYVKVSGSWGAGIAVGAVSWQELTGKPTAFPPESHGHAIADVTGLQSSLDGKQAAGSYAAAVHSHTIANVTGLQTALDGKATPADVTAAISAIVDAAPASLNTLNELAQALNDDANFATTVTTALAGKAASVHAHAIADVTGLQTALDGKQPTGSYAAATHTHTAAAITDFATQAALYGPVVSVNGKTGAVVITDASWGDLTGVPATFPPSAHTHTITDVTGLQTALDGKQAAGSYAASVHSHTIANVTGLQAALDGKQIAGSYAAASHNHAIADVSGLQAALDLKATPADVSAAVAAVVDAAPASLNTLNELAQALNDDANFATTVTTALAGKAAAIHAHTISDVTGLQSALDGKQGAGSYAAAVHTHTAADITDFATQAALYGPVTSVNGQTNAVTVPLGIGENDVVDGGFYVGYIPARIITLTNHPTNQTASSGAATFTVAATASPVGALSYQWQRSEFGDGSAWTQRTMPTSANWQSIAYGNGIFVAIADGSSIAATSADGMNWLERTLPIHAAWQSVAFGNGVFVAVAWGGNFSATSTNGANWTQRTMPLVQNWSAVAFGNDVFVAFAWNSNVAATSADGVTWTQRALPLSGLWQVAYGNGKFVAVSSGHNAVITSVDGINWTQHTLPAGAGWTSVSYGNGVFVAIAPQSPNVVTSANGINWTTRIMPATGTLWKSVAYGNGCFVAISQGSNVAATSTDGVTWTQRTMPGIQDWEFVAYGNGVFVAVAGSTQISATSGSGFADIYGATTSAIALTGLNSSDNGDQFRVIVSATNATPVTSNAATLTV